MVIVILKWKGALIPKLSMLWNKGNNKITELRTILHLGKVETHKYVNKQNQSTTGKLWKLYQGWFFFLSYVTDFSYFALKIVFRKLLDTVMTGEKWPFWKEV